MTITPRFDLTQTDTHVKLNIRVPHVRVTEESIQVVLDDDQVLHFSSPPYLLALHFAPHRFHESASEACATYEPLIQSGTICLSLRKAQPGQWENLDLLGKLTKPSKETPLGARWLREVQDSATSESDEQNAVDLDETKGLSHFDGYGFLRLYNGIYSDLTRDGLAKEMLELPWMEGRSTFSSEKKDEAIHNQRRQLRINMELEKFNVERYLQDLEIHDDYIFQCAMNYEPHWREDQLHSLAEELANLSLQDRASFFTNEEKQQLVSIPYPLLPSTITDEQMEALLVGLVDILFGYVYDHLTTSGDPTVESAWTISTLSASLSCLDDWLDETGSSTSETLISVGCSCLRRSLIYPYLRNFEFGTYCLEQVRQILSQGARCVIRCLLQARTILDHSELYYLGNKLWLDPYLAWLQRDTKCVERIMNEQLRQWPSWSREHVGLPLVDLETQPADTSSDDDTQNSIEKDSSSVASSSSSVESRNEDDHEEEDCSLKNNETVGTTAPDLLDGNLGQQSILRMPVKESSSAPHSSACRSLIEEVE